MAMPIFNLSFPGGAVVKNLSTDSGDTRNMSLIPGIKKIPLSRDPHSTPVFLPEEFYDQRHLEGYGPWGCKELDVTAHTHTHTHTLNPDTLASKIYTYSLFASLHLIRVWLHLEDYWVRSPESQSEYQLCLLLTVRSQTRLLALLSPGFIFSKTGKQITQSCRALVRVKW